MKKVLISVFVCLLVLLTLTGCKGKKTDATKAVEAMIDQIGTVTIDSADMLDEIKKAYSALSAEEKARVDNYDKYKKALEDLKAEQTRFASYDEMNAAIAEIIATAASTFTKDGTDFSALIDQGNAILKQYKEMSEEEKSHIQMTDDFEAAIQTLTEAADQSAKSAAEYVKAFNTLYAEEKYEVTAVYCIKQIRDETQYHIFALTYKDADGAEHNKYANARCSANTTAEVIAENADAFFADAPVSETYNAVENGNVTLDTEAVLGMAN